jgi:hypothetical protein
MQIYAPAFQQYRTWREQETYIKPIISVLVFALPLAVFKAVIGMYGILARHEASWLRTIADFGFFCAISTVLTTVFTTLIPAFNDFDSCKLSPNDDAGCAVRAQTLLRVQSILVALNSSMLLMEILRYAGNQLPPASQKTPGKAE